MAQVDKVIGVEFDIGGPLAEKVFSKTAKSIESAFTAEIDGEEVNVVHGLFAIADALNRIANHLHPDAPRH